MGNEEDTFNALRRIPLKDMEHILFNAPRRRPNPRTDREILAEYGWTETDFWYEFNRVYDEKE